MEQAKRTQKVAKEHLGEITFQEVAAELGCSHGTVINLERHALEKCRQALAAKGLTLDKIAPGRFLN